MRYVSLFYMLYTVHTYVYCVPLILMDLATFEYGAIYATFLCAYSYSVKSVCCPIAYSFDFPIVE